jgi:argininosuccinate synthase
LQAGALADGDTLAHPLIARRLMDLARMESALAVAHGGQPGRESEGALHRALESLGPAEIVAPAREWALSPSALAALLRDRGVHVPAPAPWRVEASLWGRTVTAAPGQTIPDEAFTLTRRADECPGHPALVDIEFAAGVPVRANGVEMPMIELIESLETIAGAHGVGRSRTGDTVIEAPAATVLDTAHRELEAAVIGADLARLKAQLSSVYSEAMSSGRWFSDLRAAIDAFAGVIQPRVTGVVKLQLLRGECAVVTREPVVDTVGARARTTGDPKVVA